MRYYNIDMMIIKTDEKSVFPWETVYDSIENINETFIARIWKLNISSFLTFYTQNSAVQTTRHSVVSLKGCFLQWEALGVIIISK